MQKRPDQTDSTLHSTHESATKKPRVGQKLSSDSETPASSLLSRTQQSAAALASNLVWGESSAAGAATSTSTLAETSRNMGEKASASRYLSSSSKEQPTWSGSRVRDGVTTQSPNQFRSLPQGQSSIDSTTITSFANERIPELKNGVAAVESLHSSRSETPSTPGTDWKFEFRSAAVNSDIVRRGKLRMQKSDVTAWEMRRRQSSPRPSDVELAQASDGAKVIEILDEGRLWLDQEFNPYDFDWVSAWGSMGESGSDDEPLADDLFELNGTADEMAEAQAIRARMPSPPVHRPISPSNPMNLRPDMDEVAPADYRLDEAELNEWMKQWTDVLERYTDDVWGPDLPAVKEAKEDIKTLTEDVGNLSPEENANVVRRLRMILEHLQLPAERETFARTAIQDIKGKGRG